MKHIKYFLRSLSIENFIIDSIFLCISLICEGTLYLKYINQIDSSPNKEQYLLNKADYYKELSVMFKNVFWVLLYIFLTIMLVRIVVAVINAIYNKVNAGKLNNNSGLGTNQNIASKKLKADNKINGYSKAAMIIASFTVFFSEIVVLLKSKMCAFLLDSIERCNSSNANIVDCYNNCQNATIIFYIISFVLLALTFVFFYIYKKQLANQYIHMMITVL